MNDIPDKRMCIFEEKQYYNIDKLMEGGNIIAHNTTHVKNNLLNTH